MLEKFKTLSLSHLSDKPQSVCVDRSNKTLSLDDNAISVLSDYRLEQAPHCHNGLSLDAAMSKMQKAGTNLLLVSNDAQQIIGLISSADISGEKPIQYVKDTGKKRDQIKIKHLMTSIEDIPVISTQEAINAQIGDILSTLNSVASEYILVTTQEYNSTAIRGVFSARVIAKSLNIFFDPSPAAKNFMDYTKALHGTAMTH